MKTLFQIQKGYHRVILVGADIPGLTENIFFNGFENIRNNPVIGPSQDGGYYLIGSDRNTYHPSYFNSIQWSTPFVLEQTVSQMGKKGMTPYFLPVLNDIATIDDFVDIEKGYCSALS